MELTISCATELCLSLHSPPSLEPCLRAARVSAQCLHTNTSQDLVCSSGKAPGALQRGGGAARPYTDSTLTCMNLVDRVTHTPQEVQVTCRTLGSMDHTRDLGWYRVTLATVTSLLPFTLTQEGISGGAGGRDHFRRDSKWVVGV